MARRPIIRSPRVRFILAGIGWFALFVAIFSCTVRIARYWYTTNASGAGTNYGVILEQGAIVLVRTTTPKTTTPLSPPILNWQIDPGIHLTIYQYSATSVPFPTGGIAANKAIAIGLALPFALLGFVLALLTSPILKLRSSECICGYNLTGLKSVRCPECGVLVKTK